VEYDEFVDRVAQLTGLSREQASNLTQTTLQILADRISGGQATDLAASLPEKLARPLQTSPQKPAEKYSFTEFVERVRTRAADVPREAVLPGIRAVMLTLRDAVPDKEFQDTLAQLPRQFREMLQEEGGREAGAPEAAQGDALVQRIAERAAVSVEEAVRLAQATLEVLGDRIGGRQAHDLAQRLPDTSAEWLDEPADLPAQDYGVDDFVSRIQDLAPGVDDDDITSGIQAVVISLRDTAGEDEVDIALQPLSDEYDVLVRVG
jgi:uncharacterized protein (DUF2267 family)